MQLPKTILNMFERILRKEANKLFMRGKRQSAYRLFNWLHKKNPSPDNKFYLALCLMNLRSYQEAGKLLKEVQQHANGQLMTGLTAALCLMLNKQYDDAQQLYSELYKANPQNPTLEYMCSLSNDPIGRDKFITSTDLQFQAGLMVDNRDPESALELLQQAVELTPTNASLYNNIGAIKLKLKFPPEEVMADFARAMELEPDSDIFRRNYRAVWQKVKK